MIDAKDSVDEQVINAKIDNLRTQYDLDKITLEEKRHKQFNTGISVVSVLLVFMIVGLIIYSNHIRVKNKSIVSQIFEKDRILNSITAKKEKINRQIENLQTLNNYKYQQLFERIESYLKSL